MTQTDVSGHRNIIISNNNAVVLPFKAETNQIKLHILTTEHVIISQIEASVQIMAELQIIAD